MSSFYNNEVYSLEKNPKSSPLLSLSGLTFNRWYGELSRARHICDLLERVVLPTTDPREHHGKFDPEIYSLLINEVKNRLAEVAGISQEELSPILPSLNFRDIILGETSFFKRLQYLSNRCEIIFFDFDGVLFSPEYVFQSLNHLGSFRIFVPEILIHLFSQRQELRFGICSSRSYEKLFKEIINHPGLSYLNRVIAPNLIITAEDGCVDKEVNSKALAIAHRLRQTGLAGERTILMDDLPYSGYQCVKVFQVHYFERMSRWGRSRHSKNYCNQAPKRAITKSGEFTSKLKEIGGQSTHFLINFLNPREVARYIDNVSWILREIREKESEVLILPLRGATPIKTLYECLFDDCVGSKTPKLAYVPLGRVYVAKGGDLKRPKHIRKQLSLEESYSNYVNSIFDRFLPKFEQSKVRMTFVDETAAGAVIVKNLMSLIKFLQTSRDFMDKEIFLKVHALGAVEDLKWIDLSSNGKWTLNQYKGCFYSDNILNLNRLFNQTFGNVNVSITLWQIPGVFIDNPSQLDAIIGSPDYYEKLLNHEGCSYEDASNFVNSLKIQTNEEAANNLKCLFLCRQFSSLHQQKFLELISTACEDLQFDPELLRQLSHPSDPSSLRDFLERLLGRGSSIEVSFAYRRSAVEVFFQRFFSELVPFEPKKFV
jgi:hypothetical protein